VATIGSSGAIRVFTHQPVLDSDQRTWCYRLDGRTCLAGGAINNGGLVLRWLIDNFFQKEAAKARRENTSVYQIISETVCDVPAGSNGLLFLPFLTGARSPDWNSKARGLIIGLAMSHSRKDLVKAAMEGVVLRLYANLIVLQELVGTAEAIVVNGGFTQSRVWLQIMADIFGKPLLLYENTGNSTLGAVLMGLKALHLIDTYDQVSLKLKLIETVVPDIGNASCYSDLHRLHEEAYAGNKDLFEQLYAFRENHAGKDSHHT
jgi:gluconokinase